MGSNSTRTADGYQGAPYPVTKRGYDLWAKDVNARGGIEIQGKNRVRYGTQILITP